MQKYFKRYTFYKKVIVAVVMLSLVSSQIALAKEFTDVSATSWYYKDLATLTDMNVIDGFPDGTFRANDSLKKDQFLKLLMTAQDTSYVYPNTVGYWFNRYMNRAYELKVIDNLADRSSFDVVITREEVSHYVYRLLAGETPEYKLGLDNEKKEALIAKILDYRTISNTYLDEVLYLYDKGILQGFTDNTFKPKNTLTRSQAVAIIAKLIKLRSDLSLEGNLGDSKLETSDFDIRFKTTISTYSNDYASEIKSILD